MPREEKRTLRGGAEQASGSGTGAGKSGEGGGGFYGTVEALARDPGRYLSGLTRWLETSDSTDPAHLIGWCCEDFKARRLKAPLVLAWLVFQAMGIIYQWVLLGEISVNLEAFESTLVEYCGSEHRRHGVCLGPAWNLSFSGSFTFPPTQGGDSQSDFDFVIPSDQSFAFQTASQPPTFLLAVEPQPPQNKVSWRVSIAPQAGSADWSFRKLPDVQGAGSQYRVLTASEGSVSSWAGSLNLKTKLSKEALVHLYVVDSKIKHLEDIHAQKQCSFEKSWENFNERHSGEHHRVLTFSWSATAFFLLVSLSLALLVLYRFFYYVESGKLLSRVIALKFVVVDFPQQMCIVGYLYGWYAANGLRCQMCLFHPLHCDDQHPLHWTNLMVCIFTLLGATANQFIVQAKFRKYDEEEECFLCFARSAMLSISILPFTTAVFFLSASLFHLRSPFVYILVGVPTIIGWGTLLCVPAFTICDDETV